MPKATTLGSLSTSALDAPFPHPTVASAFRYLSPQQQVLLPPSHSSPGKQEGRPKGLKCPEKSNTTLPVFTSNLSKGTAAMTERASQTTQGALPANPAFPQFPPALCIPPAGAYPRTPPHRCIRDPAARRPFTRARLSSPPPPARRSAPRASTTPGLTPSFRRAFIPVPRPPPPAAGPLLPSTPPPAKGPGHLPEASPPAAARRGRGGSGP